MNTYIPADKLIAEIEQRIKNFSIMHNTAASKKDYESMSRVDCALGQLRKVLAFAKSLQQGPIKVYRVENEKESKGLWRKFDGTWEPLFDMLTDGQCRDMPMGDSPVYREGGKQWFASAPSKETLQKWFSKRDLEELTANGFTISEFEVVGHKKISDFEYIFTRDNIISRTYLKVSDIYPQEQPEVPSGEDVMTMCNQILIDWVKEGKTPEEVESREEAHSRFFELYDEYITKVQPEVDLEKEIDDYYRENLCLILSQVDTKVIVSEIARHFYELGPKARKEE